MKINEKLGVPNPSGDLPQDESDGWYSYAGTYAGTVTLGDDDTVLEGRLAFCTDDTAMSSPNDAYYYKVLIAR